MRIIEPSFKFIDEYQRQGLILEQIERCGRVCYKSEDKMSEGSAEKFIKGIIDKGHESVLEMAQIVLDIRLDAERPMTKLFEVIPGFLRCSKIDKKHYILSGNPRAFRDLGKKHGDIKVVKAIMHILVQNMPTLFEDITPIDGESWEPQEGISVKIMTDDDVSDLPSKDFITHKTLLAHFIINRAVSHELVRHRVASYLQESQRYCRYSDDRFGGEVVFIRPCFYKEGTEEYKIWLKAMEEAEKNYLRLLETSSPQAARTVLPNSCKTEIMVHATIEEWMHILRLRTSPGADPSMREIMFQVFNEFFEKYKKKIYG